MHEKREVINYFITLSSIYSMRKINYNLNETDECEFYGMNETTGYSITFKISC